MNGRGTGDENQTRGRKRFGQGQAPGNPGERRLGQLKRCVQPQKGGKNSTETENFRLALSDLRCSASRAGHCLGQGETEKMHPGSGQRRERAVQGFSPSGENPWRRDSFAALGIERAKGGGRLQRLEPKITGSCESSCLLFWQRLLDSDRRPPACENLSGREMVGVHTVSRPVRHSCIGNPNIWSTLHSFGFIWISCAGTKELCSHAAPRPVIRFRTYRYSIISPCSICKADCAPPALGLPSDTEGRSAPHPDGTPPPAAPSGSPPAGPQARPAPRC